MRLSTNVWRRLLLIFALALGFRVFSGALAFFVNVVFPTYQPEQFTVWGRTHFFWDALARYDSGWYFQIARYGYAYVPDGRSSIAFFPVYPFLMRHVGRLFGPAPGALYVGGVVVSSLAFALAMVMLYRLVRLDLEERESARAVVLAAVFPFAFFYGAVYTEALFLAATVSCFYLFRTRSWIAGGACGAIATATRVNGILMWPALAWIVWRAIGPGVTRDGQPPSMRERALAVTGLLLVAGGIAGYSGYIWALTGHPLTWVDSLQRWNYHPGGMPFAALADLVHALVTRPYGFLATEPQAPYDVLNGLTALALVVAIPFVWQRFGAAYGLFMAANLWLPLSSGQFEGLGRYCAVMFPAFIWAGHATGMAFVPAVTVSAMLYMLCLALFTNIHPLF